MTRDELIGLCWGMGQGTSIGTFNAMLSIAAMLRADGEEIERLRARVAELEASQRMRPMSDAPTGNKILGLVDGKVRLLYYGKTSHVPMRGWCLADQGEEEFDLCEPRGWWPLPSAPEDRK